MLVDRPPVVGCWCARRPGPWAEARGAASRFAGHHDHPFPGCFVCGTERAAGDGLRLFPGPVAGGSGRIALWSSRR